jgi:tetratricopeptide (TPR) repeat protein
MFLGRVYASLERPEDAIATFQHALSLNPENLEAPAFMGAVMADMGNREGALQMLKKLRAAESRTELGLLEAHIYASLGEADEMFRLLDQAFKNKCAPLYVFRLQTNFGRYKHDPRYSQFLKALGIP